MKKIILTLTLLFAVSYTIFAQCNNPKTGETFNVYTEIYSPQDLVEEILSSGCISISNVVYSGSEESIGYFEGAQDILGINQGIILSTGKAINSTGENTSPGTSDLLNYPGDVGLETLTSEENHDAAVLQFNFIPASNKVKLDFVFASEEYLEYINSSFCDVFAIFISGGPEQYDNVNIALIPGTQINISPSTVNSLSYSLYYKNNWYPVVYNTSFDGFTTVITSTSNVTPCAEYSIKIAIADVMDYSFNSALFLEASSFANYASEIPFSFNEERVEIENSSITNFTLYRTDAIPDSEAVNILIETLGTAQMGVDYSIIPESVVIPAFADSVQISFEAYHYCGPDEKTIILSFHNNCSCSLSNANFKKEFTIIPVNLQSEIEVISLPECSNANGVVQAIVTNGTEPYSFLWSDSNASTTQMVENITTGNIGLTVTDALECTYSTEILLPNDISFMTSIEELSPATCYNAEDGVVRIILDGVSPYNIIWTDGIITNSITGVVEDVIDIVNLAAGNYWFSVADYDNCFIYTNMAVTQPDVSSCPENIIVEINSDAILLGGLAQPEGGVYSIEGQEITQFIPAFYGAGTYTVLYQFIDDLSCLYTCNFEISVYEDESLPDVSTLEVFDISPLSAVSAGVVTNANGYPVINRGFVWSETEYPTILENDGQISYVGGVGEFQIQLLLLSPATTYFIRAYATNINGISYGQSVSFTTESIPSEIVVMQNGVVSTCDAVFYDTGGNLSNYSNNSNLILTIEPSEPNSRICLFFAKFDIENVWDKFYVYDGPSVESPLIDDFTGTNILETICSSHSSGSLTVKFVSDGSGNKPGWAALISCESTSPCQNYSTQIVSSLPEPISADSLWINLCHGQELSMSAEVDFFENDLYYTQTEEGLNSKWIVSSQNTYNSYQSQGLSDFSYVFDNPGIFFVFLKTIDERGCRSSISEAYKILVHEVANISEIEVSSNTVCTNEQLNLNAEISQTVFLYSLDTHLDINTCIIDGQYFEWAFSFNEFEAGQQITSSNDISEICLGIEHSYIGDLQLYMRCPNGQQIDLLNQPNICGTAFLGMPIEGTGLDCVPGECWNYCFNEIAPSTIIDTCQSQQAVPAGSYKPIDSFNELIGCPLNGEWYFGIKDNLYVDDGTISFVEIKFREDLLYDTVISEYPTNSISWLGEGIDYNDSGFATAYPTSTGINQYILQFSGICGSYDTTINVFVETELGDFSISPSTDVEILQGDSTILSVAAVDSAHYQWFNSGILVENSDTSSIILFEPGLYSVIMNNSCNSALSMNSVLVTIHDSIICPENMIVCEDFGQIELASMVTQNGIFYYEGSEISEFNTFENEPGTYQLLFVIDYGCCSDTCSFFITVNEIPVPTIVTQSPANGILELGVSGYLSLESTVIGDIYNVLNPENQIISYIEGTGSSDIFDYDFTEGSYSVISVNSLGCSRLLGNFLFIENTGVNKIVAQVLYGDPLEMLNEGEASIGLYRLSDTDNEIYAEDAILLDENSLAVFDNLEDGTYYLDSYILDSDISANVADHTFYQSSLLQENAIQIVLENSTVFPATIIHPSLPEIFGTNSCSGVTYFVPETRNPVETEDMIVILKNVDLNEIIGLSVTDINGYYLFEHIPDFTNIMVFVTSLVYENYIPFETHTEQYEHYEVDFMIDGDLIYPLISNNSDTLIKNTLLCTIFPNPSENFVTFSGISDNVELIIFDGFGKLIQKNNLSNNQTINFSFLKPGSYYFVIQDKFGCFGISKFIKL